MRSFSVLQYAVPTLGALSWSLWRIWSAEARYVANKSIIIILLVPCATTSNVVNSTQLLLRHIESGMGPQLLPYRGNLTVTGCTRKEPSADFLCTTEMANMAIWNVSGFTHLKTWYHVAIILFMSATSHVVIRLLTSWLAISHGQWRFGQHLSHSLKF